MNYYIGLDVGGTNIKCGVVDSNGEIYSNRIQQYKAHSNETKEVIFKNLEDIINNQLEICKARNIDIKGVGFAFPGPFNYEKGISLIKGINKYDSIYGVSIKNELKSRIKEKLEYKFMNDADLYCIGEYIKGKGRKYKKNICLCIGTGVGSGFMEDGKLIKKRDDVPEDGWIFHVPYKKGIVDDYISARGIINMAKNIELLKEIDDVKTLADLSREGNAEAKELFLSFGGMIGEIILPYIEKFKPDGIIIGGQIAKSFDLFKTGISEKLKNRDINIEASDNSIEKTLAAVPSLFK